MADKGQKEQDKRKSTEDPKSFTVPTIEVTEEGASGGAEDHDDGKKGVLKSISDKMKSIGQGRRSKSSSPESRKSESPVGSACSKPLKPSPPSKRGFTDKVKQLFKSTSGKDDDEEMDNLCEGEVTEHPRTHLAPPEKDLGIASPSSPTQPPPEDCDSHDHSSSISSAPSGYSSLPDDDDTDAMSSFDFPSPDEEKQKKQ